MKPNETRTIPIHGIPCKFKIYDTYVVVLPGTPALTKLVEMIRGDDDLEGAIRRLQALATRDWKTIILHRTP